MLKNKNSQGDCHDLATTSPRDNAVVNAHDDTRAMPECQRTRLSTDLVELLPGEDECTATWHDYTGPAAHSFF